MRIHDRLRLATAYVNSAQWCDTTIARLGDHPLHTTRPAGLLSRGPCSRCSLQARSLSLQGWGLIDLLLRATFSPAHPLARRDVPVALARAFQSSSSLVKGVAKAALYCAHRTSTVSPCAFCEQAGHLAAPSPPYPASEVLLVGLPQTSASGTLILRGVWVSVVRLVLG